MSLSEAVAARPGDGPNGLDDLRAQLQDMQDDAEQFFNRVFDHLDNAWAHCSAHLSRPPQPLRSQWEAQQSAQFNHLTGLLEVLTRQLGDSGRTTTALAPTLPRPPTVVTAAPATNPSGLPAAAIAPAAANALAAKALAPEAAANPAASLAQAGRYRSRRNRRGNSRA